MQAVKNTTPRHLVRSCADVPSRGQYPLPLHFARACLTCQGGLHPVLPLGRKQALLSFGLEQLFAPGCEKTNGDGSQSWRGTLTWRGVTEHTASALEGWGHLDGR